VRAGFLVFALVLTLIHNIRRLRHFGAHSLQLA
jgi:hypothetical protein